MGPFGRMRVRQILAFSAEFAYAVHKGGGGERLWWLRLRHAMFADPRILIQRRSVVYGYTLPQ